MLIGSSDTAKTYSYPELTERFCSEFIYLKLACVVVLGEESEFSSRWATESTAKVEAEAETWRSRVV
jgi:hypothetical protein